MRAGEPLRELCRSKFHDFLVPFEAWAQYRDTYPEGRQPHAQPLREAHNAIFGYIVRRARPGKSMSLSANAGAYRSRPIFTSHSAIGCTAVIHPMGH